MFSVITDLNGIGKSTVLNYIKEYVAVIMSEFFGTHSGSCEFADLNSNDDGIEFLINRAVDVLLIVDKKVINIEQINQSVYSQNDSKIPITTYSDVIELLNFFKNELDDLSAFLKEK